MIKTNLVPLDELESPYWFVPDVVLMLIVAAATFFGAQYYLGTIQDDIDDLHSHEQSLVENTAKLTPDLERFKNLRKQTEELSGKLTALEKITVSKIAKYKPVIVLEHLQNLRPEGVWFTQVTIGLGNKGGRKAGASMFTDIDAGPESSGDYGDGFEIKAQAFDNILTAEFMMAMRSTGNQEVDDGDLRTQVFFSDFDLKDAEVPKTPSAAFPELGKFPEFSLTGHYQERGQNAVAGAAPGAQVGGKAPQAPGGAAPPTGPKASAPPVAAPGAPPAPPADVSKGAAPTRDRSF